MLPKPRSRTARRHGWSIFGRRGNRRVRSATPALPRPPRPPLWASVWHGLVAWRRSFLVAAVGMALAGAAWAGRWYVTHSRHFAVRSVRVSPTVHVTAEALIARAAVPLGVNLFAIDRDEVAHVVSQEPWVARAHVRRELPSTLVIDVVEREAACTVAFGALYLADADGNVFKRATPDEAAGLPVVTGVSRDDFLAEPDSARAELRQALHAISVWRESSGRAPIGEVHVDRATGRGGVTLYTDRGVGVRLGVVDDSLPARLGRYDAVSAVARRIERSAAHRLRRQPSATGSRDRKTPSAPQPAHSRSKD